MNESIPAAEQTCWNHESRLAVTTGPDGEPLCEPCAVRMAKQITRRAKLARRAARRGAMAPSIRTRK